MTVQLNLRATGDAPILKRNKFMLGAHHPVSYLIELLRKQLRFKDTDNLVRVFASVCWLIMFAVFVCEFGVRASA